MPCSLDSSRVSLFFSAKRVSRVWSKVWGCACAVRLLYKYSTQLVRSSWMLTRKANKSRVMDFLCIKTQICIQVAVVAPRWRSALVSGQSGIAECSTTNESNDAFAPMALMSVRPLCLFGFRAKKGILALFYTDAAALYCKA